MCATDFTKEISIVIVSWNGRLFVEECLASLQRQEGPLSTEVILVDNASTDGTPDLVRERFPEVNLIQNLINEGFAKANNRGIRASKGRYVCLVNSDVVLDPTCIVKMHSYMEENWQIGMLGPRMMTTRGDVGRSYMRFPSVWRCFCHALALDTALRGWGLFSGFLMRDFLNHETADVDVLNGWFIMVRRAALDEVGALDERFFMYGEDIDWSYRFHQYSWRRVYFAGAESLHYGGASSAVAPVRFYIAMQQANLQFWKKHHGTVLTAGYLLTVWLHEIVRIIGHGALFLFRNSSRANEGAKVKRSISCLFWLCGRSGTVGD